MFMNSRPSIVKKLIGVQHKQVKYGIPPINWGCYFVKVERSTHEWHMRASASPEKACLTGKNQRLVKYGISVLGRTVSVRLPLLIRYGKKVESALKHSVIENAINTINRAVF